MRYKILLLSLFSFHYFTNGATVTNCSSTLLTNSANVQFAAVIHDTLADTNTYSDMFYFEIGTNFNTAVDNGNKHLLYTSSTNCNPQIWAESIGAETSIKQVNCSKLIVYNSDNLNHYIQISRNLIDWNDILVTDNQIKLDTSENFAFFRIKP